MIINKKGQITIFIIVGIILFVSIILTTILIKKNRLQSDNPSFTKPVYDIVQNCLKETGENALIKIGEQGGYFVILEETKSISEGIPYYFYEEQNLIPSKEFIQSQIRGFINQRLSFCILNFKDYPIKNRTLNITHKLNEINVSFINKKVILEADYPITVQEGIKSYSFKNFKVELPFDFNKFYSKIDPIIKNLSYYYPETCLSCLYDMGIEKRINLELLSYGNSTIYTIIDKEISLKGEPYTWSFAIK